MPRTRLNWRVGWRGKRNPSPLRKKVRIPDANETIRTSDPFSSLCKCPIYPASLSHLFLKMLCFLGMGDRAELSSLGAERTLHVRHPAAAPAPATRPRPIAGGDGQNWMEGEGGRENVKEREREHEICTTRRTGGQADGERLARWGVASFQGSNVPFQGLDGIGNGKEWRDGE